MLGSHKIEEIPLHPSAAEEGTEVQRGEVTFPRSHSQKVLTELSTFWIIGL
jgi:hypothetical protein